MKISAITTIYTGIYYLFLARCSENVMYTFEGPTLHDNVPFFSFNKETFGNFEFNLTDEILNDEFICKLFYDQCNPLDVFFKTFRMFFKYSKIKNDDEYRKALAISFDKHYGKNAFNEESIITVDIFSEILAAQIGEILGEKNLISQPVLVEKVGDRIICKLNNSYKSVNENSSCRENYFDNETHKSTVEYLKNFNELHLKGFFEEDLMDFVEKLENDEVLKELLSSNCNLFKIFIYVLFEFGFKTYQKSSGECLDLCGKSMDEKRQMLKPGYKKCFLKYVYCVIMKDLKSKTTNYLTEFKLKFFAKMLIGMFEMESILPPCPVTDQQSVTLLTENFEKIFNGKSLSRKSIDILVLRCLEVEFY